MSHASNVICNKCLQQVFPFTELENDDFPKVFTASNQQQMLEKDFNRLNNMTFNQFLHSGNVDSSKRDFDPHDGINDITQCDYYDEEKFKQEISKRYQDQPHLSFLHLNIRSLMNKVDDLQQYLAEIEHNFSFIGISETWLDNNTESFVQLPNYSFINTNRATKAGGGWECLYRHR